MGVSTDAVLFYGLCLGDELRERIDVERRATVNGIPMESTLASLVYWQKPDLGCVVGIHCSADSPMYYIAAVGSVIKAERGYPEHVAGLNVHPDWGPNLGAFCEKYGIPKDGIGWWLVSYWG